MTETKRTRVFISYSQDSPAHQARVLALAQRLTHDGLVCALDQFEPNPAESWPVWMDRQLDEARFILVVCSKGYYRKAKAGRRPASGRGVRFESELILNDLYTEGMWNDRFLPVLFEDLPESQILRPLRGYTRYRLDQEAGYEDLLRHLTGQRRVRRPESGRTRILPPSPPETAPPAGQVPPTPYRCLAPRPHAFVARGEYQSILEHLLAAAADRAARAVGITTALRGAGGFGKTTLAQALCQDPRLRTAYPDGILWLTFGDRLTDGERLARVRDLLRLWSRGEPPTFETLAAAGGFLRDLLADRRVLVVVDDVWSPLDLLPFRDLDPAATLLVTTRDRRNLPDGCRAVDVDAMAVGEAVELLGAGLPDFPVVPLRDLARWLGEWPLLLGLVHHQLRERVEDGGLPPARALADVETVLAEEGLEAFDRQDVEARNLAVGRTLNASLRSLTDDEGRRYERLAIFPEDADIPCPTLAGLWGLSLRQTLDLCRRLHQLSLAVRFDAAAQTLRLHDVVRSCLCARSRAVLPDRRPAGGWPALPPDEPYLWRHLAYHLAAAGSRDELRALLLDYAWLEAKLAAAGVNALLADFDALGDDPELCLVAGALRLSAHALTEHSEELPGQLVGRLARRAEPGVAALRERALPTTPRSWLRPLGAGLASPGGALVRILTGHSLGVTAIAVLPDGRVVSSSFDNTLRVWDLATGETTCTLKGHSNRVRAVALSPDGRLVSASDDRTLRIWDLATGETTRILEGHSNWVRAVTVLPDGRVVSGSDDNTLRVWDLATGETTCTLEGHSGFITAVAVLPDGRVVSGSADRTLRLWDLSTGEATGTLEGHSGLVRAVAVLPDGRVVSGSGDRTLRLWGLAAGEAARTLEGHSGSVRAVAVLPDGRVVSGSDDRTMRVWDLATGQSASSLEGHSASVYAVAVLPDGRVVSGSDDRTLRLWNLATGETACALEGHADGVRAVAVLPDRRVVSGSDDNTLRVWDLGTGETACTLEGHSGSVRAVAVLPDRRVVSGSDDHTLRVWDLATGETACTLEGHSDPVVAVAALPGGRIVSASDDHTLRLWVLATGETTRTLKGHSGGVLAVAVLLDGRVVSGSSDGTLRVWDLATGKTTCTLEGHSDWVRAVAVLPDGRVVSGSDDGALRVWDLATGVTTCTLEGHSGWVRAVAVLPDGRVVSGSHDRTLRVWDPATGAAVARLTLDAPPIALAVVGEREIAAGDTAGHLCLLCLEDSS
jgi:WD40 repeat protein